MKHTKIFEFITFHTELQLVRNHCALGSIKYIDLLGFLMVKLNTCII